MNITSGMIKDAVEAGAKTLEDVQALAAMNLHGAIIGKAYYIGAINLKEAIGVAL